MYIKDLPNPEHAHVKKTPLARSKAPEPKKPYLRAPNEDDDGYDPYSDRPCETPALEEDPWR